VDIATELKDEGVQVLDGAPNEDVRFLAAIADIVRDLIEIEQGMIVLENIGRDEPVSCMAYRLTVLAPRDLN